MKNYVSTTKSTYRFILNILYTYICTIFNALCERLSSAVHAIKLEANYDIC